jgi:hypothetical protein
MAPAASLAERVGPHPSYIEIAKPYILQSRMQKCLSEISMTDAKEDVVRLQGVATANPHVQHSRHLLPQVQATACGPGVQLGRRCSCGIVHGLQD